MFLCAPLFPHSHMKSLRHRDQESGRVRSQCLSPAPSRSCFEEEVSPVECYETKHHSPLCDKYSLINLPVCDSQEADAIFRNACKAETFLYIDFHPEMYRRFTAHEILHFMSLHRRKQHQSAKGKRPSHPPTSRFVACYVGSAS